MVLLLVAPGLDIYNVMIVQILFSAVCTVLNAVAVRKYLGFRGEFRKTYAEPLLAAAIMGAAAFGVYELLFRLTRRPSISLIVSIVIAVIVYLILYVVISRTTEEELREFPLGGKMVVFLRKIRVYR